LVMLERWEELFRAKWEEPGVAITARSARGGNLEGGDAWKVPRVVFAQKRAGREKRRDCSDEKGGLGSPELKRGWKEGASLC